jgi:hypothetical protein
MFTVAVVLAACSGDRQPAPPAGSSGAVAMGGASAAAARTAQAPLPTPTSARTSTVRTSTVRTTTAVRTTSTRRSAAAGCSVFPAGSVWHADVRTLPVHASSAAWVGSMGTAGRLHPDFGSGLIDGAPFGIPVTTVPHTQRQVPVGFDYADESDPGPYPVPAGARIEGGRAADGDRHVLVLDSAACTVWELYDAHPLSGGGWHAGSGAVFDLRSNRLRPAGWTSADAAGLSVYAGLVRYEEVAAGRIDHVVRITADRTGRRYLWPARHAASSSTDPALPPMGAWFRLKRSVDLSRFPPQARVIATALQQHGAIIADNGSSWFLSGSQDERWDNDDLDALKSLRGSDFEAVDASRLMRSPDSLARR